jgi:hypothetical protein
MKATTIRERFEEKYIPEPNSGCWLWTAHTIRDGYGRIYVDRSRRLVLAHRFSWELHKGTLDGGKHVLHRCDTPCCVNPDHLFLGTHAENMQDAVKKGRKNMPKGEGHHNCKLSETEVLEIRNSSERNVDLAVRFGVTPGMIGHIKCGRAWKHLDG